MPEKSLAEKGILLIGLLCVIVTGWSFVREWWTGKRPVPTSTDAQDTRLVVIVMAVIFVLVLIEAFTR